MQRAEPAQKLEEDPDRPRKFRHSALGAFEKRYDLRRPRCHTPTVNGDNLIILHRHRQPSSSRAPFATMAGNRFSRISLQDYSHSMVAGGLDEIS
jgi:hypothetical protein